MGESVKEFLYDLGLDEYYDIFVTKGFDSESDMGNIEEEDLDCMGITSVPHRQLLLTAAFHYTPSEEQKLHRWLREHQLEYYYINFVRSELTDFADLGKMNLPDETIYDELEIVLPGHKKRLEKAVFQLKLKLRTSVSPEEPLAVGKWGKPAALIDAKYDFLCVEAAITSTKTGGNSRRMEFMVDSGSDVVTLREEVLDGLDLELLGTVRSKGVHASKEKRLYKAHLSIGQFTIEIEVMPESYDSLGSRVIRHFRHFIDGNRHVWLPGNLSESITPTNAIMSIQPIERRGLEFSSSASVLRDTDNTGANITDESLELGVEPTEIGRSSLRNDPKCLGSTESDRKGDASEIVNSSHSFSTQAESLLSPTEKEITQKPCDSTPCALILTEKDCFVIDPVLPSSVTQLKASDLDITRTEEEHSNAKRTFSSNINIKQSSSYPFKKPKPSSSSESNRLTFQESYSAVSIQETGDSAQIDCESYTLTTKQRDIITQETDSPRTENSCRPIAASDSLKLKTELSGCNPEESFSSTIKTKQSDPDTTEQVLEPEQIAYSIIEQDTTIHPTETLSSTQGVAKPSPNSLKQPQDSDSESLESPDKSSSVNILSRLCDCSLMICGKSSMKTAENMPPCLPPAQSTSICNQLPTMLNHSVNYSFDNYVQSNCSQSVKNSHLLELNNDSTPIKNSNLSTETNIRKRKLFDTALTTPASPSTAGTSPPTNSLTSSTHTVTSLANYTLSSAIDVSPSKIKCLVTCDRSVVPLCHGPRSNNLFSSSKQSNFDHSSDTSFEGHSTCFETVSFSDKCLPVSLCLERRDLPSVDEKTV